MAASIGGQSAPPSLKRYRIVQIRPLQHPIGGQSAPPSLKRGCAGICLCGGSGYRGAVRPPFIEANVRRKASGTVKLYRGAVRPPFIEAPSAMRPPDLPPHYRGAVRPPFIEARNH